MAELALCAGVDGSTIFEMKNSYSCKTDAIDEALKSARGVGIVNQIRTTLHGSMDPTHNKARAE